MAKQKLVDMQYQAATVEAAETAALGGIVEQFPTSLTARDQVGLMIKEVHYMPRQTEFAAIAPFADNFGFLFGLTQLFNAGTAPAEGGMADNGVLDFNQILWEELTAIGRTNYFWPFKTIFPGEGMIVHPASLYLFCRGIGVGATMTVQAKIFFKYIDLSPEQYQEILQTIIVQNVL